MTGFNQVWKTVTTGRLRLDYYDTNGSRIGATDDSNNYIVSDKDQIKLIKTSKGTVALSDVEFCHLAAVNPKRMRN